MKHIARPLLNLLLLAGMLSGLTACQTQPVRMASKEEVFPLLSEHMLQPASSPDTPTASTDLMLSVRVRLLPAQHRLLVETGSTPSTLRRALINTLLTPRNPTRIDPARLSLPVPMTQEPFLYGLVVDQQQFPIASREQAASYADWLIKHAHHVIRKEGHLIHRVLIPITEGYTLSDLAELLPFSSEQSSSPRTEKNSSHTSSPHSLAEWSRQPPDGAN